MTTSSFTTLKTGLVLLSCMFLSACASMKNTDGAPPAEVDPKVLEEQKKQDQIIQLQTRVQDLEARLSAMNDKVNQKLNPEPQPELPAKVIRPAPAAGKQNPGVRAGVASEHEEVIQDEAVDRYREAKILFDSNRYGDSVIEFADFVKNFPNHPFAPGAQYYLGMAYYKQKEYKIAEEEWSRGLISFPHSQYTADTLRGLMDVSDQLKKPEKATYFSQRLLMLFPNSPQAKGVASRSALPESKVSTEERPIPSRREEPGAPTVSEPAAAEPTVEETGN